ncbi:hypothetical protein GCM10009817_09320 [Terrabacter lapilli]|uniref:HTH tetR-type domain-containing protein n=2 Tax=Terrabacter lapilli TaxID=436231 RepID=A0ABN2RM16_9MICO
MTRRAAYRRVMRTRQDPGVCDDRHTLDEPRPDYLRERSRRREESRQRVETVALDLFTERGFDEVTVEQVCARAGIATATFYRYFGSKEDVFFGYEPLFLHQVARCAEQIDVTDPPVQQVLRFVERFAEFLETQRDSLAQRDRLVRRVPNLWARTLANQKEWEDTLAAALASQRGHDRPDSDDELDASLCLLVLRGTLRAWRANPRAPLAQGATRVVNRLGHRLQEA